MDCAPPPLGKSHATLLLCTFLNQHLNRIYVVGLAMFAGKGKLKKVLFLVDCQLRGNIKYILFKTIYPNINILVLVDSLQHAFFLKYLPKNMAL